MKNCQHRKQATKSLVEQLKCSVYTSYAERPLGSISQLPSDSIVSFKNTFLSNFYTCEIAYQGKMYMSVEHAYQRSKFDFEHAKFTIEQRNEIQDVLFSRDEHYDIMQSGVQGIFENSTVKAGSTKVIAQRLTRWSCLRPDWENVKMDLMIDFLLQKYSHKNIRDMLLETDKKTLIEGNDWGDTYWGYDMVEQRGKNFLGRVLSDIRDMKLINVTGEALY